MGLRPLPAARFLECIRSMPLPRSYTRGPKGEVDMDRLIKLPWTQVGGSHFRAGVSPGSGGMFSTVS